MTDYLSDIFERIASGEYSEADFTALQQALQGEEGRSLLQLGKYNITIGEGKDIQIGDRTFVEINDAAVQAIVEAIQSSAASNTPAQINFQLYLRSLVDTYKEWWRYYTLTDATGKNQESESENPSPFDFGLMVQNVYKEENLADPDGNSFQKKLETTERLPVLEGIRKYADDHVLLVGRPGSGKSTALIRLLLEMATQALEQDSGKIPILAELRYWQTSVIDRIQAFLHKHDPTLSLDESTLSSLLRQGHFLLLVDGLNELPSETARTQLASFRQDYSKVPMIFTTRDLGLGGDLGIEKKLEMQPLTVGQMQEFIRAYVPDQAEAMLRQLNDRLREFGQTPLLLWMLCEVFQQSPEHQMPSNLAGIFQAFTRMYEDSSVRKHEVALLKGDVRPLSDRRLWKPALQALAAVMMQGETPVDFRVAIHRDEAEQELGRIFPNEKFPVRDILDDLLKYHLLQNRSADQIEFRHQLIQEYYAAEYLLRLLLELSDEQLKRNYLNLLKWTESIALMLALVDDEEQALRVVKLAMDDVDLMLGARLAGEVQPVFQESSVRQIDKLRVHKSLEAQLLGNTKSIKAIASLRGLIQDSDFSIRWSVVSALSRIKNEATVQILSQTSRDPALFVRSASVEALGKIGSREAIEILSEISEIPGSDISFRAAYELAKLNIDLGFERLSQIISHQNNLTVHKAVSALKMINSKASTKALLKALEHPSYHVRKLVVEAFGEAKNKAPISQFIKIMQQENSRSSGAVSLKESIMEALEKIGGNEGFEALLSMADHQDVMVRTKVLELFGNIDYEPAMPVLKKALKDKNPRIHGIAASSLGRLKAKSAELELVGLLANNDNYIQTTVAVALGEIGSVYAIPMLLKMLKHEDYNILLLASNSLGKIGGKEIFSGLIDFLKHPNPRTRHIAARTLGLLGDKAAIPQLTELLKDKEQHVSAWAAAALIRLNCCLGTLILMRELENLTPYGSMWLNFSSILSEYLEVKEAIPILLKALENKNFNENFLEVRNAAASALDHILRKLESVDESICPIIGLILRDADEVPCAFAISVLRKIDSDTAKAELSNLRNHPHESIRLKALSALAELSDTSVIPVLIEALRSEDVLIRGDAASALGKLESKAVVSKLIGVLEKDEFKFSLEVVEVLEAICNPEALPLLRKFESRMPKYEVRQSILTIQNRCKFYNYEIFHGIIPQGKTISLYFSYVPADEPLQTQLANHLTLLERQGVITSWSQRQILPGDDRDQIINQQLTTANIILLLISANSLADNTCYTLEIQRAIERHQAGEARVIPILLRPVDWTGAPFSQLEVLPKNHQPVTTWANPDAAFQEIAESIREVALDWRQRQSTFS
jgi:HEAT repeat protein